MMTLLDALRQLATHAAFTAELEAKIYAEGGVNRAIGALWREFFPAEDVPSELLPPLPFWREVEIRRHETYIAMREARSGMNRETKHILDLLWDGSLRRRQLPRETLRLGRATKADLCLPFDATDRRVQSAILARGGKLCPADVGPALREQYQDQPRGERCKLAMQYILCDYMRCVFTVDNPVCGRLSLSTAPGDSDFSSNPDYHWIFVL